MFEDAESFEASVSFLLRRNFLRNTMGCDREVVRKATNFVGLLGVDFHQMHSKKNGGGKDVADLCE